jgi:hypothetical protein
MDHHDDPFATLAELVFWFALSAILVIIIGSAYLSWPKLDLSKVFWPVLGLGTVMLTALITLLLRPTPDVVQSGNVVGGDLVGGHLYVNVDLAELHATLSANRERYGTRASDVPSQPTKPWPMRSDVSDQPWIDGKVKSTRTPDQYSRRSDKKPSATIHEIGKCRTLYAENGAECPAAATCPAGEQCRNPDLGCASDF